VTYVLGAIYQQPFGEQLAFKGGTALRKLLFGAGGRFSVDLDFLGADTSDDQLLQIAEHLSGLDFHGARLAMSDHRFTRGDSDHLNRPTPEGFSAGFTFETDRGGGGFGLDISRRRASFLPLRRADLQPETYHRHLEFTLPRPLALANEESAAEKISALARRLRDGNAKDVYDLYLYLPRPQRMHLLCRLVALTLWSDRRQIGEPSAFIAQVVPAAFRWEELAGLLPRREVDREQVCATVRGELERVFAAMTADELTLAGDASSHREVAIYLRLADVAALDVA
jgi:Nucleotidyl transferase AbiEii toxin, Type IV TA system